MQIIRSMAKLNSPSAAGSAISMGKFDGLHRGHVRLVDELLRKKRQGLFAIVVCISPQPGFSACMENEKRLLTKSEMEERLSSLGLDMLIYYPLDGETKKTKAVDFVREFLLKQLAMTYICAGPDLSFGAGGEGDSALLSTLAKEQGFSAHIVEKLRHEGKEISSSLVRCVIERGDMGLAAALLGYPYHVCGRVQRGKNLGHKLGFATANLIWPEEKVMPPRGVYLSNTVTAQGVWRSISNIGINPTTDGLGHPRLETFIYDYADDLYDQAIKVELLEFVRAEQKFADTDALRAQVMQDMEYGRHYREK